MSSPEQRPEPAVSRSEQRPMWVAILITFLMALAALVLAIIALATGPCPGKPVPASTSAPADPIIHRSDP